LKVLIVRPEPGASASAERARALGLDPIVAPLFTVRPLDWRAPDPADFDAVLITSANAARHAGPALNAFTRLPCHAVGETSAEAARDAGFADLRIGPSDGAAAVAVMKADGVRRAFHPCGRDRVALGGDGIEIADCPVYAAEAVEDLPPAAEAAIAEGALILVHSPRAGALLGALATEKAHADIAAISDTAAEAAGAGWRSVHVASRPRDEALLELAAKLCQIEGHGPQS